MSRQKTTDFDKDEGFEETAKNSIGFIQIGGKQGIIESNHVDPSKVMNIQDGVILIDKGKSIEGSAFNV